MSTTNAKDAVREFVTFWTGKGHEKCGHRMFFCGVMASSKANDNAVKDSLLIAHQKSGYNYV